MTNHAAATPEAVHQFHAEIERHHLAALWNVSRGLMTR